VDGDELAKRKMAPILVVGATGQLGTAVIDRLVGRGLGVRALVRPSSPREFAAEGVELAFGDLRDPASLSAACRGVGTVVATANVVVPRSAGGFADVEGVGYGHLVDACKAEGVQRIVLMSTDVTPHDARVATFRTKRQIEERIRASGIAHSIFRGSLFMDDWFALMGSSIPLRGAKAATLRRPFWFARGFLTMAGTSIEKRGIALVPGDGSTRHAFVALDDVAAILAAAAAAPEDGTNLVANLGGPELLSWNEVVALFERVLGRKLRKIHTPAGAYRALANVLEPFSAPAANLMAMSWLTTICETAWDCKPLAERFGIRLTSAEEFLRAKAALPAET
jgi:NADH dehydrogenase